MSSSFKGSQLAQLIVTSTNPSLEIKLLDSDRNVCKSAIGSLDGSFEPGLYELEYGTGPFSKTELLALRPGAKVEIAADFSFSSGAPIGDADYMHVQQGAVAQLLHDEPTTSSSRGDGELVIFLRRATGTPLGVDALKVIALLDDQNSIVSELEPSESRYDKVKGEWAGASLRLRPGGYALRFEAPTVDPDSTSLIVRRTFDQSIWISAGWQSLVFIPNSGSGPNPQGASVHTVRAGEQWEPEHPATLALETMFAGLRDAKGAVPLELLPLIVDERRTNPMLGIVAAHAALLSEPPDFIHFDEITTFLLETWPEHPDVRALYATGQDRQLQESKRIARASGEGTYPTAEWRASKQPMQPVTWPPMLLLSYQGLLRADAKWPEVDLIGDRSFAEKVASHLLIGSLWSAWEPITLDEESEVFRTNPRIQTKRPHVDALISGFFRLVKRSLTTREWKHVASEWDAEQKTAMLIKEYLTQKAAVTDAKTLREFIQQLNTSDVCIATGLPLRVVQETLDAVREQARSSY